MSDKSLNYTLEDLHQLINLRIRSNMLCDDIYKKLMPDVVNLYFDDLRTKGNPVNNNFYKHMKINDVITHSNIASQN